MLKRCITTVPKPQLELTLAILKPDICRNPNDSVTVKQLIRENGFYFIRSAVTRMTHADAEKFYSEHKDKFFYTRLVSFMSSGVLSTHIIARENAIAHWRMMMGPTHVYKARHEQPESIRGRFGLTDTRNATHGSDSPQSARREILFFFPDFDISEWYRDEEPEFRNGQNIEFYGQNKWIHKIKRKEKMSAYIF